MKILVAPNSFKECGDSVEISKLFANELTQFNILNAPISDGGDGFLKIIRRYYKGNNKYYLIKSCYANNLNKIPAYFSKEGCAFVESADLIGLKRIPIKYRDPLNLNSAPLGEFLLRLEKDINIGKIQINQLIVGIGGTGIHDFGMGMMSELGLKLFDKNKNELKPIPQNFDKVKEINYESKEFPFDIKTVVDVEIPLTGKNGSVEIFAPQKGASKKDVKMINNGIENLVSILNKKYPSKKRELSGAGGGIAAALNYFFDAEIITAKNFILKNLEIKNIISKCDCIITGEGKFDSQSLLNKGTGIIIREAVKQNKKVFLCCGIIEKDALTELPNNVNLIEIGNFFKSNEESIKKYKVGIKKACKIISLKLK